VLIWVVPFDAALALQKAKVAVRTAALGAIEKKIEGKATSLIGV